MEKLTLNGFRLQTGSKGFYFKIDWSSFFNQLRNMEIVWGNLAILEIKTFL